MIASVVNVTLFVVFAFSVLYYYFTKTFGYFRSQGIKGPKPVPIFGTYWGMWKKQYHRELLKDVKKYGKVFGEFEGPLPTFMISDLDLVKQILIKDFDCFSNHRRLFEEDKYLKNVLGNMPTDQWKLARRAMTPAFSSGKLKKLLEPMIQCADSMVQQIEKQTKSNSFVDVNFKDISTRYALDIIASCAFGMKLETVNDPNNEFVKTAINVVHGQQMASPMANMAMMLCGFYPSILKVLPSTTADLHVISGVAEKILAEKKSLASQDETDFLSILLQQSEKNETSVFRDEVVLLAQMLIFMLAGFETPSSAMGFFMHCLVMNEDVQDKLRQEIRTSISKHGGLNYECIQDVPYLDQCINESLRLYPTNSKTERLCNKTVKYGDIRIDEGTLVSIPIYAIHHDPEIYPQPERFLPERFSAEGKAGRDPMAHIPFGEGPRSCIGRRFAMDIMKIGMIKLIEKFRFVPSGKTQDPPAISDGLFVLAVIMAPEIWVRIEKLKD